MPFNIYILPNHVVLTR